MKTIKQITSALLLIVASNASADIVKVYYEGVVKPYQYPNLAQHWPYQEGDLISGSFIINTVYESTYEGADNIVYAGSGANAYTKRTVSAGIGADTRLVSGDSFLDQIHGSGSMDYLLLKEGQGWDSLTIKNGVAFGADALGLNGLRSPGGNVYASIVVRGSNLFDGLSLANGTVTNQTLDSSDPEFVGGGTWQRADAVLGTKSRGAPHYENFTAEYDLTWVTIEELSESEWQDPTACYP